MKRWRQYLALMVRAVTVAAKFLMAPYARIRRSHLPIRLLAYRGYGNASQLFFIGRVIEEMGLHENPRTLWQTLQNIYRRLAARSIAGAQVVVRYQEYQQRFVSDVDGFFKACLKPQNPIDTTRLWHNVQLELIVPQDTTAVAAVREQQVTVLVPSHRSRFIIISDIDDTVVFTGVAHKIKMLWTLFATSAKSRIPFPGVITFYHALFNGFSGHEHNPLIYISRGPWVLYDVLETFFQQHQIPIGPVMFLRDWGLSPKHPLPRRSPGHKRSLIEQILKMYPSLPLILIGDSGQRDPEIYSDVVRSHPDRILAVYIRNVSRKSRRLAAIKQLEKAVEDSGSSLLLATDTAAMAHHAATQGWIPPESLTAIKEEIMAQRSGAEIPKAELSGGAGGSRT
jgi:phosphatidate phosphatase APP1